MSQQVQLLEESLLVLRDENVVLESERNPEFKKRLEKELSIVRKTVEAARSAVKSPL